MKLRKAHVLTTAAATLLLCAFTWFVVFKTLTGRESGKAASSESELPANWKPSPADADKLLNDIALPEAPALPAGPCEPRDWPAIKAAGVLRVAMFPSEEPDGISGSMMPEEFERAILASFAKREKLRIEPVPARRFDDLQKFLLEGRCDLISASYAVTPERLKTMAFTKPFLKTTEQIVASASSPRLNMLSDLVGQTSVVQPGTCYWDSMKALAATRPGVRFVEAPQGLDPETLFARVASGQYAYTVADDIYISAHLERRKDLKVVYNFPQAKEIAWAVRKDSPELLKTLDAYIENELPAAGLSSSLHDIKRRGYLRVITRNNPYCYFIHRGRAMGFEYELVEEFAKEQGLVPVMIAPPNWADMREWLLEGKGDLIAASCAVTPERLADRKILCAGRYGCSKQVLAGRLGEKPFAGVASLRGRTVAVRRSSSYWGTLEKLRRSGVDFKLVAAPESLETVELLEKVEKGEIDLTASDDAALSSEIQRGRKLKPLMVLSEPQACAWLIRSGEPDLQEAIDKFMKKQCRPGFNSAFYNVLYRKYYYNRSIAAAADRQMAERGSLTISPYDDIFRRYGARYGINWKLLAAQAFEESQFDPNATTSFGTAGLLQVMPSTAAEIGLKNPKDPDQGVHAGARYLRQQFDRVKVYKSSELDEMCFALACYNAGYGHLIDARILAAETGLNPKVWFGNVETAMLRLSDPSVAARMKYGYCKADETVDYVRDIIARFKHYSEIACPEPPEPPR